MAASILERVRAALAGRPVSEQRMFGGTCFMLNGNMLVGAHEDHLLVRVGKAAHASALARRHARPMVMRGKEMEGYIFVDAPGIAGERELSEWLGLALTYVETLPPKAGKKPAKQR